MTTAWFRRLFLAVLVALLAFAPVSSAFATPPVVHILPFDFTAPITGCDFPVEFRATATVRFMTHYDQDGNFVMEIDPFIHGRVTYTNLETGKSVSSVNAGPAIFRRTQDGSIIEILVGVIDNITVPGHGVVIRDVGRIVLNAETGEVLFEAGEHPFFTGGGVQELCTVLADP